MHHLFHALARVVDELEVFLLLLRRRGNAIEDAARVALDLRQGRREVVRDAREELLPVLLVRIAHLPARLQLAAHLLEDSRRLAELIRAAAGDRRIVVATRDAARGVLQVLERCHDVACHAAHEQEANEDDDGRREQEDADGDEAPDEPHVWREEAPANQERHCPDRDADGLLVLGDVTVDEARIIPAQDIAVTRGQLIRLVDERARLPGHRLVDDLAVADDSHLDACGLHRPDVAPEALALTAIDIREDVAEPHEDWRTVPRFRPEQLDLALAEVARRAQAVKDRAADDDEQQHRHEYHDDVVKDQAMADRQILDFHIAFSFLTRPALLNCVRHLFPCARPAL